jgi:16S rRNA (guanine527-N7)-methyltransferase
VFRELVRRCAPLSDEQAAALEAHYELLLRWNKVLNLTRIEGVEEAVERHYCESLFLASHLDGGRVADVGSGGGFPGFVVAVARPECSVTLIESHRRKAVFLCEAARKVPNVRVVAKRAEELEERFDWMISRAVSYEDLGRVRLAGRVAILTGAEDPPRTWGMEWRSVVLPWGRQRYLRIGLFHVKQD